MSHNWNKILVQKEQTVRQVLEVINEEALQLAIVVDQDKRILGTVTDGDIRRAILNDISLTSKVEDIMCKTPTTIQPGESKEFIFELMESKDLLVLPIVSEGVVIGLETIHGLIKKEIYSNPVFIMAGGFGTRLRPLTDKCPKPMLKVGGKPILETVILNFAKFGFKNIYISTHFLPDVIREYFGDGNRFGVKIEYVHEKVPLGTGGALSLLPDTLEDGPLIVINGDVLTKINFHELLIYHEKKCSSATMCVKEYEYQVPYGVVNSENGRINSFVEKPVYRYHVNAGIYVIEQELIKKIKFGEHFDMPSLFDKDFSNNVYSFPFYDYWLDIGRMDDFHRAQEDILNLDFPS
ncbi:nucleotidyltransferase family protein [bacterium]|nr:nucleotidyltransferase family protein [bacterium]